MKPILRQNERNDAHVSLIFLLLGLFLFVTIQQTQAHGYRARVDVADWRLELSRLECRLWQPVPTYGEAVFSYRAGDEQRFFLKAKKPIESMGRVEVESMPPGWLPQERVRYLASEKNFLGMKPVRFQDQLANRLLAELEEGMFPSITHGGWYNGHNITIDVSAVNFGNAYRDYRDCLANLLPVNYEQIARSVVLFETDHWRVTPEMAEHIEMLAEYVQVDTLVSNIYIDGHTDNVGRRGHNWELSRKRGAAIKKALVEAGVDPEMVTMRYHGEGRPVQKNSTAQKRSYNRRVLIILKKT